MIGMRSFMDGGRIASPVGSWPKAIPGICMRSFMDGGRIASPVGSWPKAMK
jgi:hypothetical protein